MKVDVLVIGGGSAGLAAAVTSARAGLNTVMVERHGMAGGMGTASLVHTFCGLYLIDGDEARHANVGLPEEIADRMIMATRSGPVKMGRVWVLPQHPVEFARISDELLRESGVKVLFHSEVVSLEPGWRAKVVCRGEFHKVEAAAVIDASGDAVGAAMLGLEDQRAAADRLQRPAYVSGIQGVIGELAGLTLSGRIVEGIRSGDLPKAALGMHFRSSGRPGEIFGTLDLSGEESGAYDPTDPACLSALEEAGRTVTGAVMRYFQAKQEGWERAYVSHWPARAGVRESRRYRGDRVLTGDDVLSARRFDDEVALASWPLELRETNRGPKLRYPEGGQPAGIPAGALRVAGMPGLYVAGRCISCDHQAQASIRVMGTCFATGQAAGRMVAGSPAE
ncbi:FAD-dependent oxidoreductase [Haloferula chungangensis]|uniref:FAD-dependent oxidoreductase n=1 Tax=Haloferula chungangensis TaxID=1048331 RepID=A0ABW2LCM8_9BACT